MGKEKKILEQLRAIGAGSDKTFLAMVEENYPDKDYIDVKDYSGTLYTEVRKTAALDNSQKGIIVTPVKGSSVIVSRIGESDELFVEMFSAVDSIQFFGGENEGLVKVVELTSKLNSLENDINNLKLAFNNWVVTPNDGGSKLKIAAAAWASTQLEVTNKANIQNDKIKH